MSYCFVPFDLRWINIRILFRFGTRNRNWSRDVHATAPEHRQLSHKHNSKRDLPHGFAFLSNTHLSSFWFGGIRHWFKATC